MQKKSKNIGSHINFEKQEHRLTTAPIKERTNYGEIYKTNHVELPLLRSKRSSNNDHKKMTISKKDDVLRTEIQIQEVSKRPQTSKGSRKITNVDSEYYEQQDGDLVVTPCLSDKIDMFKKNNSKDNQFE